MKPFVEQPSAFRYQELDSLRGIAAIMVVLFHLTMGRKESELGFRLGTTGVDLFFIISGFVISMSISKVSTGVDFIINRASRLYPTYWASVTITFIVISVYGLYQHQSIRWTDYLGNLTMFQYYLNIPNLDDPYWTMIIEMLFYIFILFLFYSRLLQYISYLGTVVSISVVILVNFYWNEFTVQWFKCIPLLEFFPLFFAGIIFYKIMDEAKTNLLHYLVIVGCLASQISLFSHAGRSKEFISLTEYAAMLSIFFTLFLLFVNHKLSILVSRPLLFLGKISFALYLTHQYIIIGHVLPFLVNRLKLNFWASSIFVCLPIALGVATAITYFIEIPYSRKMKQKLQSILAKT